MKKHFQSKSLAVLLAATLFSALIPTASANSLGQNTIADITVEAGTQYARIALNGSAITGRPACHNATYTVHYGFDVSTAKGKALLSLATAASLAGKTIRITGSNACVTVASGLTLEDVESLVLFP